MYQFFFWNSKFRHNIKIDIKLTCSTTEKEVKEPKP